MKQTDVLLWAANATNKKTGPIPTAYIGRDPREARKSCEAVKCPLLGHGCYAWEGKLPQGHWMIQRANRKAPGSREGARGLRQALAAAPRARSARIGALGDPSTVRPGRLLAAVRRLRAAGLRVLSYTHAWRTGAACHLKSVCMASTENDAGSEAALADGWRPAQVVPADTDTMYTLPSGKRLLVCPAQRTPGVTCDRCRVCDPKHPVWTAWNARDIVGIAFRDHSRAGGGAAVAKKP